MVVLNNILVKKFPISEEEQEEALEAYAKLRSTSGGRRFNASGYAAARSMRDEMAKIFMGDRAVEFQWDRAF